MRALTVLFLWLGLSSPPPARSASPGNAPALPLTGKRIVNVATEAQLQTAMSDLQSGDTVLLADGVYNLTSSLYINGRNDVTIRGSAGSLNVVLVGKGMNNANSGNVPFGIWSNGTNTTIAHPDSAAYLWNPAVLFLESFRQHAHRAEHFPQCGPRGRLRTPKHHAFF